MCWGCSLHLAACPATLPWALGGIREVPRWPLPGGSRKRVQKGTLTSHLLSVMGLMLKSLTRPRSWYMCSRQLSICGDESRAWLPPTGPRPPPSREKSTGPAGSCSRPVPTRAPPSQGPPEAQPGDSQQGSGASKVPSGFRSRRGSAPGGEGAAPGELCLFPHPRHSRRGSASVRGPGTRLPLTQTWGRPQSGKALPFPA